MSSSYNAIATSTDTAPAPCSSLLAGLAAADPPPPVPPRAAAIAAAAAARLHTEALNTSNAAKSMQGKARTTRCHPAGNS